MKAILTILPALFLMAPALASEKQGAATPVRSQSLEAEFKRFQQDMDGGDNRAALVRLDRILALELSMQQRQRLIMLQGLLLVVDGQRAKGLDRIAAAEAIDRDEMELIRFKLEFAYSIGDAEIGRAALETLMMRDPESLRAIRLRDVIWIVHRIKADKRKAEADALVIHMEQVGVGSADIEGRSWLKLMAARALIVGGRARDAAQVMRGVHRPDLLRKALVDRAYAPIWPEMEAQAGPHMATAAAAALEEARRTLGDSSDRSPIAVRALVDAYREVGRFEEADALASGFAAISEEMAVISEDGGWLIDSHAATLRALERPADADKRYAAMALVDIGKSPWRISMVINRLHMLVEDGRWKEAAALQDEAGRMAERHGSPYARQLVRRLKLCTLHALDPKGDLSPLIKDLKAHEKDAAEVTAEGLMCVGRMDEAEVAMLQALADAERVDAILGSLQPFGIVPGERRTIWTDGWSELGRRPAIQAALNKIGRILPQALWSVGSVPAG